MRWCGVYVCIGGWGQLCVCVCEREREREGGPVKSAGITVYVGWGVGVGQ